jgi:tRNA(fMet)-specific endonuclease VapC
MVRGYLLDTNILKYWFNEATPEHHHVIRHLMALDVNAPLRISAISLGEMEYGHRCESDTDTPIQTAFKDFVNKRLPDVLRIHRSTSIHYGHIRANLFKKYAPKNKRSGLRPCQLVDPITATSLGIQENDLWIAAQAIEFNLVLVTHDRLSCIKEVASELLEVEDWAI